MEETTIDAEIRVSILSACKTQLKQVNRKLSAALQEVIIKQFAAAYGAEIIAVQDGDDFGERDWLENETNAYRDAVAITMFGALSTHARDQFMFPFNA